MVVKILSSESMGVRSMATYIDTNPLKIIIDPSCALCPLRFGLPPHLLEIREKEKRLKEINSHLELADIVIITHYHYDHFTHENIHLYNNKLILIKDPQRYSHPGLRRRAEKFLALLPKNNKIEIADARHYTINNTEIIFSEPLHHGLENSKVYVISVCIKTKNMIFLHSSDIQGINTEKQLNFIQRCSPDILFLDGFPLYLIGQYYTARDFERSLNLLEEAISYTKTLIIDHHITRTANFRSFIPDRIQFVTSATFMREKELLLEAKRRELYSL